MTPEKADGSRRSYKAPPLFWQRGLTVAIVSACAACGSNTNATKTYPTSQSRSPTTAQVFAPAEGYSFESDQGAHPVAPGLANLTTVHPSSARAALAKLNGQYVAVVNVLAFGTEVDQRSQTRALSIVQQSLGATKLPVADISGEHIWLLHSRRLAKLSYLGYCFGSKFLLNVQARSASVAEGLLRVLIPRLKTSR